MFDTNDVYNDAVRGSIMHIEDRNKSKRSLKGSKIMTTLLLVGSTYIGFNYYNSMIIVDKALVVKDELVAEIQIESELQVEPELQVVATISDSEADYLSALRDIESELIEETENINLDTSGQMSLSSAMNDLMNDTVLADNTNYTKELRKEIGAELDEAVNTTTVIVDNEVSEDSRTVVVQKGDTLRGISDKFYGDELNYKRIIASNDSLISNDTIYVGQTILLPY